MSYYSAIISNIMIFSLSSAILEISTHSLTGNNFFSNFKTHFQCHTQNVNFNWFISWLWVVSYYSLAENEKKFKTWWAHVCVSSRRKDTSFSLLCFLHDHPYPHQEKSWRFHQLCGWGFYYLCGLLLFDF